MKDGPREIEIPRLAPGTDGERDRKRRSRRAANAVTAPTIGYIPSGSRAPVPTLTEPQGAVASSYTQTLERLQATTTDEIFLVTGGSGESRPGNAALNLAVAAAGAGLRAVLIDADTEGRGATRYLRTGEGPGLAELATGTADLKAASRLLTIGEGSRLPVIPAGSGLANTSIASSELAAAIDLINEYSDLVLVAVSHGSESGHFVALGAHADGSILVINEQDSKKSKLQMAEHLSEIGAPVVGVVERAREGRRKHKSRR